jgi:glycosyltransferase involved in cell wall biosynthesis
MSKRLALYERGLKEAGVDAVIVTTHRPANSAFSAYADPFIIPFHVRKQHHETLKSADVILVDGFNWFSFFWFGFWYGGGKRKLIYELNERPGTVYTSRLLELPPIKKIGLFLNKVSMKVFDGFIVISEPLREYIGSRKKADAQVVKLPIIIDTKEPFVEVQQEIPAHPYIVHTGALSQQKDGIVDVFRAFAKVNAQLGNVLHFYVAGKKNAPPGVLEEIDRVINAGGLKDNVHFIGVISEDTLRTLQKHCLFLVLPKPDNEQNRNNFPTKLGEFLAFSKPVITTPIGDMKYYMKQGESAIIVEPGNTDQIAEAMIRLMNDKALSERLGNAGKKLAEQEFDYAILGRRLADFCKTLNR